MSLEITDQDAFEDFLTSAEIQIETWDVDPLYPVVGEMYDRLGWDEEQRLWYTSLFTCYYWMKTIEVVHDQHPHPQPVDQDYTYPDAWNMKVRKERRCVYQKGAGAEHMSWMAEQAPLTESIVPLVEKGGQEGWDAFREWYEQAPHAGGWASYKFADMLKYAHGYDITASDMGTGSGVEIRGPLAGIQLMTNLNSIDEVEESVNIQWEFYDECQDHGVGFKGLEQMETCLCNYKSMTKGNYYVGCDIDNMQRQINNTTNEGGYENYTDDSMNMFYEIRSDLFPDYMLGEKTAGRRAGEVEAFNTLYRDEGIIRWWEHYDKPAREGEDPIDNDPDPNRMSTSKLNEFA